MTLSASITFANIGRFLSIEPNEPLPFYLVGVMAFAAFGVLAWTAIKANAATWKSNWRDGISDDYGFAQEVSQTIAHPSERWCVVLPGMLLVLGLLGTFIGLGVALSSASENLKDISNLELVLNGVGAKFKTSAWGIIFYLFTRLAATGAGWEEKRLSWCLARIEQEKAKVAGKQSDFQTALSTGIQKQISKAELNVLPVLEGVRTYIASFVATNEANMAKIGNAAQGMADAAASMVVSAATMKEAAGELEKAAGGLEGQIQDFGDKVDKTLISINAGLFSSIEKMEQTFGAKMGDMADSMSRSTSEIGTTMVKLQVSVDKTMRDVSQSIEDASKSQRETIQGFEAAAELLSDRAVEMADPIKDLGKQVQNHLKAMTEVGLDTVDLAKTNKANADKLRDVFDSLSGLTNMLDGANGKNEVLGLDVKNATQSLAEINRIAVYFMNLAERDTNGRKPS
jgi:hypothetical protein